MQQSMPLMPAASGERGGVKRRLLALVAILVVTAGCAIGDIVGDGGSPVDMTPSTLVGTWQGGGRYFTFRQDGTFSAVDLPPDAFSSLNLAPRPSRLDGWGAWSLPAGSPHATVHLNFDVIGGVPIAYSGPDLTALRQGKGNVYLAMYYEGSGGNEWTNYVRCADPCAAPSPSPTPS
jgi:hypothetical protein